MENIAYTTIDDSKRVLASIIRAMNEITGNDFNKAIFALSKSKEIFEVGFSGDTEDRNYLGNLDPKKADYFKDKKRLAEVVKRGTRYVLSPEEYIEDIEECLKGHEIEYKRLEL